MSAEMLDLRGLKCPLPTLFARRALSRAPAGAEVTILSDDPMATIDVPHMCHQEGHEVLAIERLDASVRFVLRRRDERTASVR
jgi:tRNA 2-thiouridine synthesizing protein A